MRGLLLLAVISLGSSLPAQAARKDVFWIAQYGNVTWSREKAVLFGVADQAERSPGTTLYLFVSTGMYSCEGDASRRALRARDFLVNDRHIPKDRVVWKDIGYSTSATTTIYLFRTGSPLYIPDYSPPSAQHQVFRCGSSTRSRSPVGCYSNFREGHEGVTGDGVLKVWLEGNRYRGTFEELVNELGLAADPIPLERLSLTGKSVRFDVPLSRGRAINVKMEILRGGMRVRWGRVYPLYGRKISILHRSEHCW